MSNKMTQPTHHTVLFAEDGIYYEEHKSEEAAHKYVTYQMGDDPTPYDGGWQDSYGRHICIRDGPCPD